MRWWLASLVVLLCGWLSAHPLPSFQFDRQAQIIVQQSKIEIRYQLEISLFAMAVDSRGLLTREEEQAIGGRQKEFAKAYAEKKGPLIADSLIAKVDDHDLSFQSRCESITFEETHAKIQFVFTADRPFGTILQLNDQSFEEKAGAVHWKINPSDHVASIETQSSSKPPLEMTSDEIKQRRIVRGTLKNTAITDAPQSPDILQSETIVVSHETLFHALKSRGLIAFFDSNAGYWLLLLVALLFGAAHALTPGHGKTLVAAYLVGERGTFTHAILLGLSTTLSHTGSVIAVAIGLRIAYRDQVPETVQGVLQLIGGLMILGIGFWLFMQRVRNRADHVHLHFKSTDKPSWIRVVLLGLAGGIIPCWDAVMLLLVAIAAGRLAFALPLLIAFSLGLAAVLIVLGMTVVFASKAGGKRFGESRWFRMLPVLSALVLVGLGAWLCRDGWTVLMELSHADR